MSNLIPIYDWSLEIPVYKKDVSNLRSFDEYMPKLLLLERSLGSDALIIGRISVLADERKSADRWMVEYYPLSSEGLSYSQDAAEQPWRYRGRRPPRFLTGQQKQPRDNPKAAVDCLLKMFSEDRPKLLVETMTKVANLLIQPLDKATIFFLKQVRI